MPLKTKRKVTLLCHADHAFGESLMGNKLVTLVQTDWILFTRFTTATY